ncbi:hypothetical protein [Legionella longbeachae]|uniref:hypothetical protein n=1 Tax=Legionella longbeachae TaxID=450 RepID=UPI00068308E9|nr:hypothetical protein [Legionella longbeachae]QIN31439.1 hypothetical protein GCB94_04435 [Legionella longbeachae]
MPKFFVFLVFSFFSLLALASENQILAPSGFSLLQQFSIIELGWMSLTVCFFIFFFIKFDKFAVTYGPEILTTMGIVGCFACIAWALLHFNSENITASIPFLLNGIKTAFCSSFIGVSGALLIRGKHKFSKVDSHKKNESAPASMDDLVKEITNLRRTLSGDEEGSLISQIKMFRQDSNDQQKKLQESFDNFAKHMVENNQKAFIEALKEAIRDFNQNLTEQFGENFKHLNQSVEKLIIWQEQYKHELETIKQYQSQFSNDMKQSSDAFATVVEHAKQFTDIAQNLKILLNSMDKQKDVLFAQEKALSELLATMKDHIPEFSSSTQKMITEISEGVKLVQLETTKIISNYSTEIKLINNEMKSALADILKEAQNSFSTGIKDNMEMIQEAIISVESQTADVIKNHSAQLQSTQAEMKNVLVDGITKSQQEITAGLQENAKIIREGVLALDKELEKGLTDSLTSLGKQLASLSEKFVSDYLPLTERLRDIVRLAKNSEAA